MNDKNGQKKLSRYLALVLRHRPELIGITLDEHGWANISKLIEGLSRDHIFNMDILEEIVRTDSKQRFSFNDDRTLIRANSGHSVKVDVGLKRAKPPEYLYHGSAEGFAESIKKDGLIPGQRLYVHLSEDIETALAVGSRHGKPVVYRVKCLQMEKDGFDFYLSVNGIWQTEHIPPKYLERLR